MSVILAVAKSDHIDVLADAAFYDDAGVLTSFLPKVREVPRANAVFACRGTVAAFPAFIEACARFGYDGFDDFVHNAAEDVLKVVDGVIANVVPGRRYEILIAGWSEKHNCGLMLYHHTGTRRDEDGLEAGRIYILGQHVDLGVACPWSVEEFDPQTHGVQAFEDARRTLCDLTCGSSTPVMGHSVGGYLNHAVVSPRGVDWDVLKFWPDQIGEKIKPEGEILAEGRGMEVKAA